MARKTRKQPTDRVLADLLAYDSAAAKLKAGFTATPSSPSDKDWVIARLAHLSAVDQFMRGQVELPFKNGYSQEETRRFWDGFGPRFQALDVENTRELKELLTPRGWFRIGEFGKIADSNAWLLVQHADQDIGFQKEVLALLEPLHKIGETDPSNYAYLYDRVAVNENRPQRYGTQGRCVGPGKWEPDPLEDPARVDELRNSVGLPPLEEYKKRFVDICH